ncbi:MAG: MG2 domain-containing protein, partial [Deltaproteobacteria bacterium]
MRFLLKTLLFTLFAATASAQSIVPDRIVRPIPNTDFPGNDLRTIFDTSYESCRNACVADQKCGGLTFNQKANACFLKSDLQNGAPFEGAYSVRVTNNDASTIRRATERMADLTFLNPSDVSGAQDAAFKIGERFSAGDWSLDDLLAEATKASSNNNWDDAITYVGAALTLSDRGDLWSEFARVVLGYVNTGASKSASNYDAEAGAINGYLRAENDGARVTALVLLSESLEKSSRFQDMIEALRVAETIQTRDDVETALDRAIRLYGFGIRENTVESDLASPRICAQFSEPLLAAASEYQSYVRLEGVDPVLSVSGSQLCVEGLKHGLRYTAIFRKGLPAASGETLAKDVELKLYVRDRSPQISFPGRGYILPAMGQVNLPIEGVNTPEVDLTLSRMSDRNLIRAIQNSYFAQPLDYYSAEYVNSEMATEVWSGKGELKTDLNQEVTTLLPLGDEIGALKPGVYVLQASIPGKDPYDFPPATQWFVASDLGLMTMDGNEGLHVIVRSLQTADAKVGIKVDLVSQSNEVLASATTDDQGHVLFDAALTHGVNGAAPAMVMAAVGDDDFSFLPLTDPEFDLSDRGVEGRAPAGPVDIFMTTDRGAYRAGETIYVTALARDPEVKALSGVPMTAILYRPDGQEYSRQLTSGDKVGGNVFALPVAGTAPRGSWRIALYTDPDGPSLASTSVLVEDFLPQRIDFALSLPEGMLSLNEVPALSVDAKYLFGAPGADFTIEGEAVLRQMRSIAEFPGYVFGLNDTERATSYQSFDTEMRTDENGQAVLYPEFPYLEQVTTPLEVAYHVRVAEGSGRPVERIITAEVAGTDPIIGIKREASDDVFPENSAATFSLLALDAQRKPVAMEVHWEVNRVNTRYQWYSSYGQWNWEPVTTRTRVAEGKATLGDEPVQVEADVKWGEYEIKVERSDGPDSKASDSFYAGWYVSADTASTPDTLELSLDKTMYLPGDTATLRIVPRYAGKALVSVLSDHVITMQTVDVVEGENTITLPVTDDWGAGAYVTASVIRPMDTASDQNPARALGLSYAKVDPGAAQLKATIEAPAQSDPRGPLPVAVKVDGISPGETAYVTIAAIDVGILNLTNFKSPDPSNYYFGQRRLGVALRDVYGRLIDGMSGETGVVRSGGDSTAADTQGNAEPPTEELVAYFQGPIEVGADGYARTTFDIPSFNGSVRIMAVVWSKTGVGQAETDVIVRDPVVVSASVPRFMAPGDSSRMLLELIHTDGPAGEMQLAVTSDGLMIGDVPA